MCCTVFTKYFQNVSCFRANCVVKPCLWVPIYCPTALPVASRSSRWTGWGPYTLTRVVAHEMLRTRCCARDIMRCTCQTGEYRKLYMRQGTRVGSLLYHKHIIIGGARQGWPRHPLTLPQRGVTPLTFLLGLCPMLSRDIL